MKKMLLTLIAFMALPHVQASLGDQITTSLIDHVAAHSQYTTKGENRLALLSDVVEIGKIQGSAIGQIRFGFTGIMNPDQSVTAGAGYVGDIYLNISPFIRKYVSLNPDWSFLKAVEMGPSYAYDFREHKPYVAFSIGLAFGLNPKP